MPVIVPLRRPPPPYTRSTLFKQAPDGTWSALESVALVTADGQFAMYEHTGGLIATGTDAEAQPLAPSPAEIPVIEAPLPVIEPPTAQPPISSVQDGTSNTIIVGESTPVPTSHKGAQSP